MTDVDLVIDAHAVVGEGARWDGRENLLLWVDIPAGLVHRYHPDSGKNETFEVGRAVGAIAPRQSGGLVLAVQGGFAGLNTDTSAVETIAGVETGLADHRMNDGACDSAGRFWAGTMEWNGKPGEGTLYRLGADHSVEPMLGDLAVSNGIGWSPDDRLMYFIDTPTQGIDVFDYEPEEGRIANRRRLITVPKSTGSPDGMNVDADGCLWVALWNGWAIHRYTPDGKLDMTVRLPTMCVTCCAFGGPDMRDFFITTSARDLSPQQLQEQPHAGGLFHCRPGPQGVPARSYLG